MTYSMATRRRLIRLAKFNIGSSPRVIRLFGWSLMIVPVVVIALTLLGLGSLVPLLSWLLAAPMTVAGLIRLRQENRRRCRQGVAPIASELPSLYATGWVVILLIPVVMLFVRN